jgi:hypothetical protein
MLALLCVHVDLGFMMTSLGTFCKSILKYHSCRLGTIFSSTGPRTFVWPSSVFPHTHMFPASKDLKTLCSGKYQCLLFIKLFGFP